MKERKSIIKTTTRTILFTLSVLGLLIATLASNALAATTRYVNHDGVCGGNSPCYTTIQAAINDPATMPEVTRADPAA